MRFHLHRCCGILLHWSLEYPVAVLSKVVWKNFWDRSESFPAVVRGSDNLFDAQLFEEPSAMVRSLSVWILLRLPGRSYLQNWRIG